MKVNELANKVIQESKRFLMDRGMQNIKRANILDFLKYVAEPGFKEGDLRRFKVNEAGFEQMWGTRKNGQTVYITLIAPYDDKTGGEK
jgi:hypothetical protein